MGNRSLERDGEDEEAGSGGYSSVSAQIGGSQSEGRITVKGMVTNVKSNGRITVKGMVTNMESYGSMYALL